MSHNKTDVYVHSVVVTRVTNQPSNTFYELCHEVGRQALANLSPLKIDSFYVASMDPSFTGVTGEVAASLAAELGVVPKEILGIRGTSSAGGVGCIPAYKDIASGLYDYSMVVSCEQMNPVRSAAMRPPDARARERAAVQRLLAGVIDPAEQAYGLTMVLIGDLIERALAVYLGLSWAQIRETVTRTTLAMYRRAAHYPYAHFYHNDKSEQDVRDAPAISSLYRRDDVVPISTGACAVVFSSRPPHSPLNDRVVRLRGVGQGIQSPALTARFGPLTVSPSIRRAIFTMLRRSGIRLETLQAADIGFPHDAFPSISRMILKEVGFSHRQALLGLLGGRFNPCGGLVKCGHPVGCSGELQLARAHQQLTRDPSAIPHELQQQPADTAFTVSVGAALTNIVAFYLDAFERGYPPLSGPLPPDERYFEALCSKYLSPSDVYGRFERAMRRLPCNAGVVLGNTRGPRGWINLVQLSDCKLLALTEEELELGALVQPRRRTTLNEIDRVLEPRLEPRRLADFGIAPEKQTRMQPAAVELAGAARASGGRLPLS